MIFFMYFTENDCFDKNLNKLIKYLKKKETQSIVFCELFVSPRGQNRIKFIKALKSTYLFE